MCIKTTETINMKGESARRSTKSNLFVESRFDNWKKALEKGYGFERQEKAEYHEKLF